MFWLFIVVFFYLPAVCAGQPQVINAMLVFPRQVPVQLRFTGPPLPAPAAPRPRPPAPPPTVSYPNCGSQSLGQVVAMNMKKDAALSAKAVEVAVRERFKGPWFVTCGYDELFFSKSSPSYCEVNSNDVYCYAFRPYRL